MTQAPHSSAAETPDTPRTMLGGLSPAQFMRRYWQKKPLLIRNAFPGFTPFVNRQALFAMAADEVVESRMIVHKASGWTLRHGPFARTVFPPLKQPRWTLLVQGVDLHLDAGRALLERFRFVPDARLDDLMISWASDGGGVGPHFDSYDVFLLQASGQRHWRIGRQKDLSLEPDVPLKILSNFEPEEEHLLNPGDMLYLPPRWAHDGVAVGDDCMTYSIGFRVPQRGGLAGELLQRMADDFDDTTLYRDPDQAATDTPAAMPQALEAFAADALQRLLAERESLACALGEVMTEPKPKVWFEEPQHDWVPGALTLDRRTRMMYDARHVFINGDGFRAAGADARLMRSLADTRSLGTRQVAQASPAALALLQDWFEAGWLHRTPAAA
ncbi:transcription factor jumonji jmjc domain-containing protein [Hydrogenophaga taeniospiralis CCUG 15921]|uniref:Transcription factor jumonji jmjc domain-containing protein n=1 Tax=Hydrogenophaga taeniospiralis CCUG 15921 TaxID=1281780 RepID=A0A9X4NS82_9BURK|nr:cupin domain-containing protein [Hydrogenophaga taeniospiralis]MDG5975704.1 transcription factor jumonji jmjc domain-containing protein [Hydrogenophaga taeniospiralis CCUG 15921]